MTKEGKNYKTEHLSGRKDSIFDTHHLLNGMQLLLKKKTIRDMVVYQEEPN